MPTIKGTDGDTTGALVTNITTSAQLTALVNSATQSLNGALSAADKTYLDSVHTALPSATVLANLLATIPTGAGIQGFLQTDEIDFLATSSNNAFKSVDGSAGTLAGKKFLTVGIRFVITQLDGTITTGPTTNAGNDVAKTNVLTSAITMTAANINAVNSGGGPPGFATSAAPTGAVGKILTDTSNQFDLDVTVAATANTATKCKGRVYLAGFWV